MKLERDITLLILFHPSVLLKKEKKIKENNRFFAHSSKVVPKKIMKNKDGGQKSKNSR